MPQEQKKRERFDPNPKRNEPERKTPADEELDDILDEADKIIKRNKEQAEKKQPRRQ